MAWNRIAHLFKLGLAVALVGVVLTDIGGSSQAASGSRASSRATPIGIGEREFSIAVYRPVVRSGRVRFNIRNYGEDVHDLVVISAQNRRIAASKPIRPGGTYSFEAVLKRGSYRLICTEADHLQRGMRAALKVRARSSR